MSEGGIKSALSKGEGLIYPLEISAIGTKYEHAMKRAIRRALHCVSSKMVGGLSIWP